MVFNTNQNRHLFVASNVLTSGEPTNVGDIAVKTVGTGQDKQLYFLYKGPDTVIKSDYINIKNISYAKAIGASDMVTPLKSVEVTINDDGLIEGAPIAGQDYVLRINLHQFYGMSDEDQYFKDAVVHVTSGMTLAQFYTAMKNSLDLSFSREVGASKNSNPYLTFTAAANKLTITEKEQGWNRGLEAQESVLFEIFSTSIYKNGDEQYWADVKDVTPKKSEAVVGTNAVGNGKKVADLEWFCAGERGDQYRYMGYPNYIPTTYLVNPTEQYDVLEIHHAFTDTGVNSYRSEKDITVVAVTGSIINSLVAAINTAVGDNNFIEPIS